MCYHYIALTDDLTGNLDGAESPLASQLRDLSMAPRSRVGRFVVFTPKETPILPVSGGSVLIGDLFDRNGKPVTDLSCAPHFSTQQVRQHLLDHYWGEYLLIQADDKRTASMVVTRDPSGGMPCAYSLREGSGFIASDLSIASRLGLSRHQIDWDFVRYCLIYPHVKVARTGFSNVSELLPGCMLAIDDKTTSTALAWSPWRFVATSERQYDPDQAAQSIREIITSVIRTMAEADKSLLLELSGGLDSSIIGTCLKKTRARIACCTAVTPLPGADERRYASLIAEQLGVRLLQQPLDFEETDIEFPLPQQTLRPAVWVLGHAVARAMDEAAAQRHVESHFSGSGGDSVFCYLKSAAPAADAFRERGLTAGYRAIVDLSRLHGCTVVKASRLTIKKLFRPPKPASKPDYSLLTQTYLTDPLEQHPWFSAPTNALPGDRERIFDLACNQMFVDATLRSGNRRVRMPLLSQPVMEACLRIPSWMWISGGHNRALARAAFMTELPLEVLNRRSKGTFVNYTFGIYHRNKEAIRKLLLGGHLQSRGLLDAHALDRFLDRQLAARDRSFMRVFSLCMIENWLRNQI